MGVEHLYAQTGHVLQNVSSEQQEETPLHAIDTDDEDNEGFSCEYTISNRYNKINSYNINLQLRLYVSFTSDGTTEVDDPTVAYTGDQLVPETFQSTEGDPADDYVGPKNIPGYDRVASRSPGHLEEVLGCPDLSPGISDHCPLEKTLGNITDSLLSFLPIINHNCCSWN